MVSQLIAGTSGYRGITFEEITPEDAWHIGNAFMNTLLKRAQSSGQQPTNGHTWKIALAWDTRHGAAFLADCASLGVRQAGGQIYAIGKAITGVLSTFVREHKCDGAIFVTGSHMPHTRVGIILMNADATYCTAEITDAVTQQINSVPFTPITCKPDAVCGNVRLDLGGYDEYIQFVVRNLPKLTYYRQTNGPSAVQAHRVLVDTGNGPAACVTRRLLHTFRFKPVELYRDEMAIPERESEVSAESCKAALERMREHDCVMGACFDTDADRVLFIDETGTPVVDDVVAAIFAKEVLQAGDSCVTPYNSAPLIEKICGDAGATLHHCEIGQPDTGRAVKEINATFAYEAAAGKFMWPQEFPWYDGVYAMLRMLEIMQHRDMKLSELVAQFPPVYRENRRVDLSKIVRQDVDAAVARACAKASEHFGNDCLTERRWFGSALRLTFQDGSRLLMRASGTEPIARSYGIADTVRRAEKLANLGQQVLENEVIRAFDSQRMT